MAKVAPALKPDRDVFVSFETSIGGTTGYTMTWAQARDLRDALVEAELDDKVTVTLPRAVAEKFVGHPGPDGPVSKAIREALNV